MSCIYTMHGQSAIRFIPLIIATGKDSTIKCYEVDYIRWITKKYNYAMYIIKKKNLISKSFNIWIKLFFMKYKKCINGDIMKKR